MKIPSLDNTESVLLIIVAGFGLYVAYKAYQKGAGLADNIKKSLSDDIDAVKSLVSHPLDSMGITTPEATDDTSIAIRNQNSYDIPTAENLPFMFSTPPANPLGTFTPGYTGPGTDQHSSNENQIYSPEAVGEA